MSKINFDEQKKNNDNSVIYASIIVFGTIFLAIVLFFGIIVYFFGDSDPNTEKPEVENYYDNSKKHQMDAYFAVKHRIKDNLRDPDSYDCINEISEYNEEVGCYQVTVKYSAKNAFNANVTGLVKAAVEFDSLGVATVTDWVVIE